MECPRCEKRVPSSSAFCRRCGLRLTQQFTGPAFRPQPSVRHRSPAAVSAGRMALAVLMGVGISFVLIK